MEILKLTKKEKKAFDKNVKLENWKKKWTILKAALFNKKLSPNDTRTLQAHKDAQGNLRNYYISNPYLQDGTNYTAVTPILEDPQNNQFLYRGIVGGADNAIGILKSNVPLSEIVASTDGNIKLQEILTKENASTMRDSYYARIGEKSSPLEKHTTYFGKPDFILGTLQKTSNGKYFYSKEILPEIEEMLSAEREELKKEELMRNKDSVQLDIGGGMVVAKQNCWLEQGKGIQFAGINKDALFYNYMTSTPIQTPDNKYVYIGETQIGENSKQNYQPGEPIHLVRPFHYKNIVLWTDSKNLIQYFLEKKLDGLNLALGDIFTNGTIRNALQNNGKILVGGLTLDEDGICKHTKEIPESVKEIIENHLSKEQNNTINKIIKLKYSDEEERNS